MIGRRNPGRIAAPNINAIANETTTGSIFVLNPEA